MKKQIRITLLLVAFVQLTACINKKKTMTYRFPAEMSESVKSDYTAQCERGRQLYELNCAGCHNNVKGRKKGIPDFTAAQLEAYQIRGRGAHEERVSEERVNAEELTYIVLFLTYKERSGIPSGHAPELPH